MRGLHFSSIACVINRAAIPACVCAGDNADCLFLGMHARLALLKQRLCDK